MRAKILRFDQPGVVVRARWRRQFTLTYGEILTAERTASGRGLRLHTRITAPLRIKCSGDARAAMEDELRRCGVRIVDEWGAIIAPTMEDFEVELACGPEELRQSSDNG